MKKVAWLIVLGAVACDGGTSRRITEPGAVAADLSKYVAIGASISMGFMSDGVFQTSQMESWPYLLAKDAGVTFKLPLINAPGCPPPFAAPLAALKRIDNSFIGASSTCANNEPGTQLPTQNVAVSGATAADAMTATGAAGGLISRVLPATQTQVTAMRAQNPTFVSVELGAAEMLAGISGQASAVTPFATFSSNYQAIIDQVKATGAKAVLVTIITDVSKFPAVRTSAEIASQRTAFSLLNVSVNADCNTSPNLIAMQKVVGALATGATLAAQLQGPFNLSCADVPGTADYVLTPQDVTTLNALLVQMNNFITAKATENGYATFSLDVVYASSKDNVSFNIPTMLASNAPFGPNISLDSVHPSPAGQVLLANAAKAAIIARYGSIGQ